jgi:hypothetical protein
LSDYSYSKDVPEELRMIHRFLRESNQLKFKSTPNYARFKWMARNIFLYVGLERSLSRMAEELTRRVLKQTNRDAAERIAKRCIQELRKEE